MIFHYIYKIFVKLSMIHIHNCQKNSFLIYLFILFTWRIPQKVKSLSFMKDFLFNQLFLVNMIIYSSLGNIFSWECPFLSLKIKSLLSTAWRRVSNIPNIVCKFVFVFFDYHFYLSLNLTIFFSLKKGFCFHFSSNMPY